MFANGAMSAAQEINRSISVAIGTKTMESAGLLPGSAMAAAYPVRMGVRILNNPANGYGPFMLSGLMANGAQIGLMVAFAPVIVTEIKRRRCGKKVPVPFMFLAKFLPYWFFGMIAFMLSLLFIVYGFDVPMLGHWQDLLLLGLGYYFFVGCILMLFSACAPSRPLSLQAPMLYIMPGLLYSGLSWPPFDMSTFAWYFSRLLPITYIGDNMRDVLLMGHAPGLGSALQAMSIGGCIAAALAVIAFKFRIWLQDRKGVEDHGKDAADTSA
jgi:ABC-2 type transport system permease protein